MGYTKILPFDPPKSSTQPSNLSVVKRVKFSACMLDTGQINNAIKRIFFISLICGERK